jgi:hypothetical protein
MKKSTIYLVILAAAAFVSGSIDLAAHYMKANDAAYNCVQTPEKTKANEYCASESFYRDYREYKALREEVSAEQQSSAQRALQAKLDHLSGMVTRLQTAIPKGFHWNETKLMFEPDPPPVAPVPVPAPAK